MFNCWITLNFSCPLSSWMIVSESSSFYWHSNLSSMRQRTKEMISPLISHECDWTMEKKKTYQGRIKCIFCIRVCVCVLLFCRHSIRVYHDHVKIMQANVTRFLLVILRTILAHVNQASLDIAVKPTSTIVKVLLAPKTIQSASTASIHFIVNANLHSNEVRINVNEQSKTIVCFLD
jgi:hypothetical protein